ncbi:15937_t:CDS:2, partial [Funneliformis geosporum]
MKVIQADLCYLSYDQIENKIYKFALNCVDIATRIKWTYPLTNHIIVEGDVEFLGDIIRLMNKYDINILIGIIEKFNKTLQEWYNNSLKYNINPPNDNSKQSIDKLSESSEYITKEDNISGSSSNRNESDDEESEITKHLKV